MKLLLFFESAVVLKYCCQRRILLLILKALEQHEKMKRPEIKALLMKLVL